MKRSSLVWYAAVACLGGSLCIGSVVQADSSMAVKANSVVPTSIVTQAQPTQSVNITAAQTAVANNEGANDVAAQAALKQKQQYQAETETMGLLWMRTSAEYRA